MFQKLSFITCFTKFEETFIEQNKKIDELEEQVSFLKNNINQLLIKCEDNEQYSRRTVYGFIELNLKK